MYLNSYQKKNVKKKEDIPQAWLSTCKANVSQTS